MDTISFNRLLLRTVFCCMVSDCRIDNREINFIKSMCEESKLFKDLNIQEEINFLVEKVNSEGKSFIQYYFDLLKQTQLSEEEELILIDFAIKTIKSDDQIEYSEIKFFKNIRYRLKVSDKKILERFPDIELYLEQDIIIDGFLEKITNQYLEEIKLTKFDLISFSDSTQEDKKKYE